MQFKREIISEPCSITIKCRKQMNMCVCPFRQKVSVLEKTKFTYADLENSNMSLLSILQLFPSSEPSEIKDHCDSVNVCWVELPTRTDSVEKTTIDNSGKENILNTAFLIQFFSERKRRVHRC